MTSASRIKDKCVARGSYLLTHSDDASKMRNLLIILSAYAIIHLFYVTVGGIALIWKKQKT